VASRWSKTSKGTLNQYRHSLKPIERDRKPDRPATEKMQKNPEVVFFSI